MRSAALRRGQSAGGREAAPQGGAEGQRRRRAGRGPHGDERRSVGRRPRRGPLASRLPGAASRGEAGSPYSSHPNASSATAELQPPHTHVAAGPGDVNDPDGIKSRPNPAIRFCDRPALRPESGARKIASGMNAASDGDEADRRVERLEQVPEVGGVGRRGPGLACPPPLTYTVSVRFSSVTTNVSNWSPTLMSL